MLRDFEVHIFNLSEKIHEYSFEIDNAFFSHFENSPIDKGKLTTILKLDKRENLIEAKLEVSGKLKLTCDLSLEEFDFPIKVNETIIYKYGEEEEELDDNIFVITKGTQKLDFAQVLFEIISLQVPMKKVHPELETSDEPLFYSVGDDEKENEKEIDPRWQALKGLKNKE